MPVVIEFTEQCAEYCAKLSELRLERCTKADIEDISALSYSNLMLSKPFLNRKIYNVSLLLFALVTILILFDRSLNGSALGLLIILYIFFLAYTFLAGLALYYKNLKIRYPNSGTIGSLARFSLLPVGIILLLVFNHFSPSSSFGYGVAFILFAASGAYYVRAKKHRIKK